MTFRSVPSFLTNKIFAFSNETDSINDVLLFGISAGGSIFWVDDDTFDSSIVVVVLVLLFADDDDVGVLDEEGVGGSLAFARAGVVYNKIEFVKQVAFHSKCNVKNPIESRIAFRTKNVMYKKL